MQLAEQIVGRAGELRSIDAALAEVERGRPVALELEGEPGIGKTRLLAELGSVAERRGFLVLTGATSELENELPFWVFVDALEEQVRNLPPATLPAELDHVLAPAGGTALPGERHRAHNAVRELLALLARRQPLVLALDDLHWADSGSLELLGALLRRPPAGPVLIALAMRPRQAPERLLPALERAHRAGTLSRIELGALSREEARALLGEAAADAVYEESGGNPFYLQQLARALGRTGQLPRDVTAALAEELALLSEPARRVLQGAAVAGDPFAPELAAAAADVDEAAALEALDELLALDLVRATDVPRRFRFRHPLVRRAVYDAAPGGWRLAAHERAEGALATAGASAAARAHHVERFARLGDMDAVATLRDAGLAADRTTPASAAHWFAAALRILPADADDMRLGLLLMHARALAQSGDLAGSRAALLDGLRTESPTLRTRMIAACATVERLLGRHAEARARVERALDELPDRGVPDAVQLMMELAVDAFFQTDWMRMWEWARKAHAVASELDDAPILAACTGMVALADAMAGLMEDAQTHCDQAGALVDALPDEQLAERVDAGLHLMVTELHLDRFAAARRHGQRALDVGRATGQGLIFPNLVPALGACCEVLGRLGEAVELIDDGIEAARLSGNAQALSLALMNRSAAGNSMGDVETALACGEESLEVAADLGNSLASAFAGFALVRALLLAGEPTRALELLLTSGGGEELPRMPGAWRAGGYETLTHCRLGVGDHAGAARAAERCRALAETTGLRYNAAQAGRAAAALALDAGEPEAAAEHALDAAALCEELEAPVQAAQARSLAGRALAASGDRSGAIAQYERAAETFERCGAPRRRDMVERELRRLGRTVYRRSGASGLESLTARELEIAQLVVDRQTNTQIAETLFLSKKTVETHLRNIFGKLGVSSRVELARTVERAERSV